MAEKKRDKIEKPKVRFTREFAARVRKTDGNPRLEVRSPRFYAHELGKFQDGEEVSLLVTSRKLRRTEQQNRYYWGVYLPLIARETGEQDLDRLHELFKGKFMTTEIAEVLGEPVRMKRSTTDLSIGEFCEYIMAIQNLTHIEAPPTENYGLDSLREGIKKMNDKAEKLSKKLGI